MTMTRQKLVVLMMCFLMIGIASAHGGHEHGAKMAMGTVQTSEKGQVKLTMSDGQNMVFTVDGATRIMTGDALIKAGELKKGTRAAIKYDDSTTPFKALEIKLAGSSQGKQSPGRHDHGSGHQH